MKLIKLIWNVLLGLAIIACFKENKFFQSAVLMIIKCIKTIIISLIEVIKNIPTA